MTAVRQCVVLVGGLGTRLGRLVADVPKPMLDVAGRPFLSWLLGEVARYPVDDVLLLTGHLSEVVERALPALRAALPRPMSISVSREPVRAGTGGALFHAAPHLQERFLLMNGDSFLDCSLATILSAPQEQTALARLMLRRVPDTSRYGVVTVKGEHVTSFLSRPAPAPDGATPGTINAGIYLLDRRILDRLGPECSLEQDILPGLAKAGQLRGVVGDGWFIDIGIPEDLRRAQSEIPERLSRPALFLDRDGVCNFDHGWVGTPDRFDWMDGAQAAIANATAAGWHVFIVTNQSGVARGFYTEADVAALLRWMQDEVLPNNGTIDDTRYCPFHPEAALEAYRKSSDWRKPAPGMIVDLLRAWRIDPARCHLVGDQQTDMQAAAAVGMPGHLFPGGPLDRFVDTFLRQERR